MAISIKTPDITKAVINPVVKSAHNQPIEKPKKENGTDTPKENMLLHIIYKFFRVINTALNSCPVRTTTAAKYGQRRKR